MKADKESFSVSKIQRNKEGLTIDYGHFHMIGDDPIFVKNKQQNERHPSDEFIANLNKCKQYVANIIHYGSINKIIGNKQFKCTEDQSRILMRLHQDLMQKIQINGIEMFGADQDIEKCSIKYSLEGLSGQNMDNKTYKIDLLESNIHGFEDELKDLCETLISQSYDYLFKNEGGQGDLFNQDQEEQEEQEES